MISKYFRKEIPTKILKSCFKFVFLTKKFKERNQCDISKTFSKMQWLDVTRKRGSEIKQHTDHLHDLKRPCSPDLLHIAKTSDLALDTSWPILPGAHHKIRNVQVLYSHRPAGRISQHPSPTSHIHKNANKRIFPIINYIHFPKAQAFFLQNVHKKHQVPTVV
jgi:hypothetical protein